MCTPDGVQSQQTPTQYSRLFSSSSKHNTFRWCGDESMCACPLVPVCPHPNAWCDKWLLHRRSECSMQRLRIWRFLSLSSHTQCAYRGCSQWCPCTMPSKQNISSTWVAIASSDRSSAAHAFGLTTPTILVVKLSILETFSCSSWHTHQMCWQSTYKKLVNTCYASPKLIKYHVIPP